MEIIWLTTTRGEGWGPLHTRAGGGGGVKPYKEILKCDNKKKNKKKKQNEKKKPKEITVLKKEGGEGVRRGMIMITDSMGPTMFQNIFVGLRTLNDDVRRFLLLGAHFILWNSEFDES